MTRPRPDPTTQPPGTPVPSTCDCDGPCLCAAPVPLLRWFAVQVSTYHGPAANPFGHGRCGRPLRMCGVCMLVATLYRAARDRWSGVLP